MAGYLVFVVFMTVLSKARGEDLAAPTLSVNPEIITKSGSVTLHCQAPVPTTHCLYSFDKAPFKPMPCRQTIKGSELLSLLNINFPSEINVACFYLNVTASPSSEKKVISVRDPGPPTVSVHPSVITEFSSVTLYCKPPMYVTVSSCSFYTLSGLEWASSCTRTLRGSDLLNNQSAPAEVQVKCYYTEQNEETSSSPHSDETIVAVKVLAPPTLTLEPSVITEMDRVILHCQPPSYVSASLCYFYTVSASGGKSLDAGDCIQNLTGSDLFLVNKSPPIEVEIQCFYIVYLTPSPHSDKRTVTVKATKITSTTSPPSTSTLFNPATRTGTQAHVTTVKAHNSDSLTATKSLIKMLVILLTAGGVTVGCVLLVVTFFCTKQRNVKSQAPNSGGQPVAGEYSLCRPEPATDSQAIFLVTATVTEIQPDPQQEEKVTEMNPYHEYASIPDTPYSVSMKNVMYRSVEMTEQ